ncbi:MAG: RecX family transcriptional regulator [Candidatus Omnitrophica bacterium]|nr:RecX family transcriptional regulator [Candidatus Omnitrophota bacterium]
MSSSRAEGKGRPVLAALPRYLRSSVRSSCEVVAYLRRRGLSPQRAARAVLESQASGLLDDEACARLWADHWARRGWAWAAIRAKLSLKGLDERAIDGAVRHLEAAADDGARARLVAAAYLRRHAATPTSQRTLARSLAFRGFDADLIDRVLRESFEVSLSD